MSKPTGVDIELLPQGGEFILSLLNNDQPPKKIKGRFSMYALDRFCADKDITYLQAIGKITLGMRIGEYAELLVYALQDYFRQDFSQAGMDWEDGRIIWDRVTVMDYIMDPMEGLGKDKMLRLFKHAVGRLGDILEKENPEEVKKKKSGKGT